MRKLLALLLTLLTGAALTACGLTGSGDGNGGGGFGGFGGGKGSGSGEELSILAATELKDLEPLVQQASEELGFPISLEFPAGTLQNSQDLKHGKYDNGIDATWLATNRYMDLIGARGALADETKIATSPVAFGVQESKAKELGWDKKQPTWGEFADAAREGKFTFGMTDPSASNSGFSALVSVATAMADTGSALSDEDIAKVGPRLHELFQAQSMVSGSSGWLAESFQADPDKTDAIVNYESTLHQMRKDGAAIEVIVPADGVVSADYPLSTLTHPKHEGAQDQVKALADWLLDHQQEIADSFRRPVGDVDNLPAELGDQTVIELPFPASQETVAALVQRYNNEYRRRGTTSFVLDTSGSMEGERLDSVKQIMTSFIDGSASTDTGNVALRDGEQVTFQSFSDTPHEPVTGTFSTTDAAAKQKFQTYVDDLKAAGKTNIYDTLMEVTEKTDPSSGISSIVLLSDGAMTAGRSFDQFKKDYAAATNGKGSIPVFVILYGEAQTDQMEELADVTGGAVFDAINGDLSDAFKEIRGYQ